MEIKKIDIKKTLSFIPLGGVGDVTRNMYVYEYGDQILLVDCGLGFADETMIGVDLLLPDITYLLETHKTIVGLVFTHGHEDHIGALPFILPQLFSSGKIKPFPMYGSPLTAALANEKLKEFGIDQRVEAVPFENSERHIGDYFTTSLIHITHSVPDSANILIKTPVGNIYHGSDFKFDLTPANGRRSDLHSIAKAGKEGILCLMSDCLGAERTGATPSEEALTAHFEREMRQCLGKFIVTTYSSNISRINQAILVAEKLNRKVCFVGRSLLRNKEVAQRLGYMQIPDGMEIKIEQVKRFNPSKLLLIVAGSQGQENSAMTRIATGEHKNVSLSSSDVVVFSSDPIPGNELSVNSLIDTISKVGARVFYSDISRDFHVSGHGSSWDLMLMMSLAKPKNLIPIGGTYRHMVAYRKLAQKLGYNSNDTLLLSDGQEVIFSPEKAIMGKKLPSRKVYVDEITGEELESFILRDRQKLSEGGVVIVMVGIDSPTGQLVGEPDVVVKGFTLPDMHKFERILINDIQKSVSGKQGKITNPVNMRKFIGEVAEKNVFTQLRRRPLILPIVIEV